MSAKIFTPACYFQISAPLVQKAISGGCRSENPIICGGVVEFYVILESLASVVPLKLVFLEFLTINHNLAVQSLMVI